MDISKSYRTIRTPRKAIGCLILRLVYEEGDSIVNKEERWAGIDWS